MKLETYTIDGFTINSHFHHLSLGCVETHYLRQEAQCDIQNYSLPTLSTNILISLKGWRKTQLLISQARIEIEPIYLWLGMLTTTRKVLQEQEINKWMKIIIMTILLQLICILTRIGSVDSKRSSCIKPMHSKLLPYQIIWRILDI